MYTLDQYFEDVLTTAHYPGSEPVPPPKDPSDHAENLASKEGLIYASVALGGEVGEYQNEIKKMIRDDSYYISPARRDKLKNELGDILWYVAANARELGFTLEDIARENILKLAKRYKGVAPEER